VGQLVEVRVLSTAPVQTITADSAHVGWVERLAKPIMSAAESRGRDGYRCARPILLTGFDQRPAWFRGVTPRGPRGKARGLGWHSIAAELSPSDNQLQRFRIASWHQRLFPHLEPFSTQTQSLLRRRDKGKPRVVWLVLLPVATKINISWHRMTGQ
jgi:hypothetical protein